MKIFLISQKQFLPITIDEAWSFFSDPRNLTEITPETMDFKIEYVSGDGSMYPGQLIKYRIKIIRGIRVNWLTEITQVKFQQFFIDEQRFGPYAFWHHQHLFKAVAGGTEMIDEVNYALPLGWLGRIAHALFVGRQLREIFMHRQQVLQKRFKKGLYGTVTA